MCVGRRRGCNRSSSVCVFCLHRRVHISSVTLEHLKGSYKVEPGDGQSRDSYLKEHGVVTFLVINPKVGIIDYRL